LVFCVIILLSVLKDERKCWDIKFETSVQRPNMLRLEWENLKISARLVKNSILKVNILK